MRTAVLAPLGIDNMRLGASLESKRAPDEARYYTNDQATSRNAFPGKPNKVPLPYGGFHLEAMDAHGGWIGSALDLVRFALALDEPSASPLRKRSTLETMLAPPPSPVWRQPDGAPGDVHYGCGWMVRSLDPDRAVNFWHAGSLPGTFGVLARRADGVIWAALFNQRSDDPKLPNDEIDPMITRAIATMTDWPAGLPVEFPPITPEPQRGPGQ